MAIIAPTAAGSAIVPVAAVGPDKYLNHGTERLYVVNGSASLLTITFNSQQACDQGFDHDGTATVAAGATRLLPALSVLRYNDGTDYVNLTYDSVTTIDVAVLQV